MGLGLFQKHWLNNVESHGTVVLMYHLINDKGSSPVWRWAIALLRFHSQLDLLNAEGWQTVCVHDLMFNNRLPKRNIVITFDDGYVDNLTACEELEKRGMHATWFIVSGSIGREPAWLTDGRPDGRCVNAVRKVGYRAARATRTGWALLEGDPHQLRRLTVFNSDTASSLARKLYFGSNDVSWHAVSRYALQRVTSRMRGRAT